MVEKNSFSGEKCIVNQCCNKYAFLSNNFLPLISPAVKVIHCMGATRNSGFCHFDLDGKSNTLAFYSPSLIPESGSQVKPLVGEARALKS